jgi:ABC transporter substrate binding protein (PQQ-dependent alcohol dehydrogenase system)
VPVDGDALAALDKLVDEGIHFVLVDAPAAVLLKLADAAKDKVVLLFNIRSRDVALRNEDCRFNVLHTAPDRNMLADALAQYLIWKQWNRWFLVNGTLPEDVAFADAMKRAAKRFGGKIVAEKEYEETPGARRTDTGQMLVQRQMPVFTQMTTDYDVLVVADENEIFGPYVPYRTWAARPVAGTSGLYASSWHPAHEQWGATQMQNRFQAYANRFMLPLDYQAWVAVRTVGEAATRTNSADYQTIAEFIRSEDFNIAAFMGQRLTYRPWDHQLRLPILVTTPHIPVSVSPQEGFLHPKAEVDTLGTDEPETKCSFN